MQIQESTFFDWRSRIVIPIAQSARSKNNSQPAPEFIKEPKSTQEQTENFDFLFKTELRKLS